MSACVLAQDGHRGRGRRRVGDYTSRHALPAAKRAKRFEFRAVRRHSRPLRCASDARDANVRASIAPCAARAGLALGGRSKEDESDPVGALPDMQEMEDDVALMLGKQVRHSFHSYSSFI